MKKQVLFFYSLCMCFCVQVHAQIGVVRGVRFYQASDNVFRHVIRTSDNASVALCYTYYPSNLSGMEIVKYDDSLHQLWKTVVNTDGGELFDIIQTSDGGFIACGTDRLSSVRREDVWVIKFDRNGTISWQKYYGGTDQDFGAAIKELPNGNFVFLGEVNSFDGDVVNRPASSQNIWLGEITSAGVLVNQKIFGGTGGDGANVLNITNDGGLIFGASVGSNDGQVFGNHGLSDIWIVKLNSNYDIEWSKVIGGSGHESPSGVYQTAAGDYIVGGTTSSVNGDLPGNGAQAGFVLKLDNGGNIKWTRVIKGAANVNFNNIRPASSDDILAIGTHNGFNPAEEVTVPAYTHYYDEGILYRFGSNGSTLWSKSIGAGSDELSWDVLELPNGNLLASGTAFYNSTDGDFAGIPNVNGEMAGYLLELRNLNTIRGTVFYDSNINNSQDAGEAFMTAGSVGTVKPNFQLSATLPSGKFFISVDTGKYTTSFINSNAFDPTQFAITPKTRKTVFTAISQTDSFSFRVAPIGLVKDLQISIAQLSPTFLANSSRFRIKFKNLGGAVIDTANIKLKLDTLCTYASSNRPLLFATVDTAAWQFLHINAFGSDSIDVTLNIGSIPAAQPGNLLHLSALAEPYVADFDSTDNSASLQSTLLGQNGAIGNASLLFSSTASVLSGNKVTYTAIYDFKSQLDSTKGTITLVKDRNTSFVSASPDPYIVSGDTVRWRVKDLQYGNADTVVFVLKTADSSILHTGDLLHQGLQLLFNTFDTSSILLQKTITQPVAGYFITPDNTIANLLPPNGVRWARAFGGSGDELAYDVTALPDSGFVVVGASASKDNDIQVPSSGLDGFISRFDKDGRIRWIKTMGGQYDDMLLSVKRASDGNLFAAGIRGLSANGQDALYWVVKLNEDGDTLWTRKYSYSVSSGSAAVLPTADGGCAFVGTVQKNSADVTGYIPSKTGQAIKNIWLVKLDAAGVIQWQHCYTDTVGDFFGTDLVRASDGFVLSGFNNYGLLIKTDTLGNKLWTKQFRHGNSITFANSMVMNSDNTIMVAGAVLDAFSDDTTSFGLHGYEDVWVAKMSSGGDLLWEKLYGGTYFDYGNKISSCSDGNYLVAGIAGSTDGNITGVHSSPSGAYDGWLLKVDPAGKLLWQKTIGGDDEEQLYSAVELKDGNLLAVGLTSSLDNGDVFGFHGVDDVLIAEIGQSDFVTGHVFIDKNGSGKYEAGEPAFTNGQVLIRNAGIVHGGKPDNNGLYSISMDAGNYTARFVTPDSAYYSVSPASVNTSFSGLTQTDTIDFALVKKGDFNDLAVDMLPLFPAKPGFQAGYMLNYRNKGTVTINNTSVRVVLDPRTDFYSAATPYAQRSGDTLIWNIGTLDPQASGQINLVLAVKVPPIATVGDTLLFTAQMLPVAGDNTPQDNQANIKQDVRSSFDPNDKIEVHGNYMPLQQAQNNEYLTYVIRFQNTGNDVAYTVDVRDTLDSKLDWNSFEMISASHHYDLSITGGNKLEWKFNNIFLPDSNSNEPASHGYIAYRVKPVAGLAAGDSVINKAFVYFDFNLPVVTNKALTNFTALAALPSTILGFDGKWSNAQDVLLNWYVTNEYSVSTYIVERSTDGSRFSAIGSVHAHNSGGFTGYDFTDSHTSADIIYYRLHVVDIDGKTAYSKIIKLAKSSAGGDARMMVYPNPVAGKAWISFTNGLSGTGAIKIMDAGGILLFYEPRAHITKNGFALPFDFSAHGSGLYYVQVQVDNAVYYGSVIKQ